MFGSCEWLNTHTHTHLFNGPLSGTTWVSQYQKGKNNLDFTEARDSECQWHQLGHMQVCTSLQTDNDSSTPLLSFLQAGCPSCRPTNSVKALKAWLNACVCCQDEDAVNSWCYLHENDVVALLNQFPLQRVFNHVFNCTHTAGQCSLLHWAVKPPQVDSA